VLVTRRPRNSKRQWEYGNCSGETTLYFALFLILFNLIFYFDGRTDCLHTLGLGFRLELLCLTTMLFCMMTDSLMEDETRCCIAAILYIPNLSYAVCLTNRHLLIWFLEICCTHGHQQGCWLTLFTCCRKVSCEQVEVLDWKPHTGSRTVMCRDLFVDSGSIWIVYLLNSFFIYFIKNRPILFPGWRVVIGDQTWL